MLSITHLTFPSWAFSYKSEFLPLSILNITLENISNVSPTLIATDGQY